MADKKDHLGLLYTASELAARLAGSADLETFHNQIVQLTASHLKSDVCSIYLFDESAGELVLRANVGLDTASVGSIRLALGEGLTGVAVKELRPVREQRASRNPNYKHFAGTGEEDYDSFLAVPISRGAERIGALVVQRDQRNYFTRQDELALAALAAQLASVFENTRLLMNLRPQGAGRGTTEPTAAAARPRMVKGRVASRGYAHAPAAVRGGRVGDGRLLALGQADDTHSLEDFHQAVSDTARQLQQLQAQVGQRLPEAAAMIFEAHLVMLKDRAFVGEMQDRIQRGQAPSRAVAEVAREYNDLLAASTHAYIREKVQDVTDLARRLLDNLHGSAGPDDAASAGHIVVAGELYPSDVLSLACTDVRGVVLVSGGVTTHVSILARSLHLPVVIVEDAELLALPEGTDVLLDAEIGNVYVQPSAETVESFGARNAAREQIRTRHKAPREQTRTADGVAIRLLANVNLLSDIEQARLVRAQGVGLYRSEFPYLVRTYLPTEAEQHDIYSRLFAPFDGQIVTFRTLDIGGDKLLVYFDESVEQNPAMGLRSIRFSFRHDEVFRTQLRAVLRAGARHRHLRIMFPMVASLEDLRRARQTLSECREELAAEALAHHGDPAVGIMIEVPSAVELIDDLAAEADFLSVGTNDLTQFMLAVDRGNQKLDDYYVPHHPAVLRAMKRVAAAAIRHGRDLSVCGEMAHEQRYLPFLIGIGVRDLSVDPQFVPTLQDAIERIDSQWAKDQAEAMLAEPTIAGIDELIQRSSRAHTPAARGR